MLPAVGLAAHGPASIFFPARASRRRALRPALLPTLYIEG